MSAHTPGPWKLSGWTAPDDYGWSIKIPDAPHRIEISAWSESSEADARLIAAAPELLSALRRALSRCHNCDTGGTCSECESDLAAIAKAEGKR